MNPMPHDSIRPSFMALNMSALPARTVSALLAALSASAPLRADVLELTAFVQQADAQFGESVAGVPDVNGDGLDDVVVGSPNEDVDGIPNAGRVTVDGGRTGGLIQTRTSPNPTAQGRFGDEVEGLDDIDGDGRGDYLVGAPRELAQAGRVYLYSGATHTLLRTIVSPNTENGGFFGSAIAAVPDLTGDGVNDYIIGAYNETVAGTPGAGRVYI